MSDGLPVQMITSLSWKMQGHMTLEREGRGLWRDDAFGVQMEVITPRSAKGAWGKSRSFFFIDGDDREFHSEENLIEAFNDLKRQEKEDPAVQVVYKRMEIPRIVPPHQP